MVALSSNLANPRYGYNLLLAMTQDALSARLHTFLAPLEGQVIELYLQPAEGEGGGYRFLDPSTQTPDIFARMDGAKTEDEGKGKDFPAFGFRGRIGPCRDALRLDRGNRLASVLLRFDTLDLFELRESRRTTACLRVTQPAGNPWVFRLDVPLTSHPVPESERQALAAETQKLLSDTGQGAHAHLWHASLDLDTAELADPPVIDALDTTGEAYTLLTRLFIRRAIDLIRAQGRLALATVVSVDTPKRELPFILPTGLATGICQHRPGPDEPPAAGHGLSTLNLLTMSDGALLSAPESFDWNWMDGTEPEGTAGVIAIGKQRLAEFIGGLLESELLPLCRAPRVEIESVSLSGSSVVKWELVPDLPAAGLRIVGDDSTRALSFRYEEQAMRQAVGMRRLDVTIEEKLELNLDFDGDAIRIRASIACPVQIVTDDALVSGEAFRAGIEAVYRLRLSPAGDVLVTLDERNSPLTVTDGKLDTQTLEPGCTLHPPLEQIEAAHGPLAGLFQSHGPAIERFINGSLCWILPFGQRPAARDAGFSHGGDLNLAFTLTDPPA